MSNNVPAPYDLSAVPIQALEALRLRLTQLTHSLGSMHTQLLQPVLPSWPALHNQFSVILKQLQSLSETLSHYSDVLKRTVAYPLPEFPALQQAGLLATLLRKKPLPEVETWIKDGKEEAAGVKIKLDEDFCKWAADEVKKELQEHEWAGFLTAKEVSQGMSDAGMRPTVTGSRGSGMSVEQIMMVMAQGPVALSSNERV